MNAGSNNPGDMPSMIDSPNEGGTQPTAAFPDEPFACPHCGQMLAPSCRTCPSCRQAIDPNEIVRPEVSIVIAEQIIPLPTKTREYARFSWSIFFAALVAWFLLAVIAEGILGYEKSQFALGGVVLLSSLWVLYDARQKNIPKPFRWSIGSLLLWIVIFPWYLSRRRTPKAACPFIEGEGRHVRTLIFILLIFFLLSALMLYLRGPAHSSSGDKSPATKTTEMPAGKIAFVTNYRTVHAWAKAPSDASQT